MAVVGPSKSLVGEGTVPGIQGMLQIDDENPMPRVFNFQGMDKIIYREIVQTLLQFFPDRMAQYQEDLKLKEFKRQNPTGDANEIYEQAPREFGEITSMKDWEEKCMKRKACAIGLLPAIMEVSRLYAC